MYSEPQTDFRAAFQLPVTPSTGPTDQVVRLISRHKNIPAPMILSASRCRVNVARARQLAMYLAHVILGESLTAIGHAFGRDRTTVSYACALIEDLRDDPAFDAAVTDLELELQNEALQ
ncbi:chromosomal replication initiator DnaA [Devosia sp. XJ19-1]|uniref:Chromosomal replication initiator DnaA n=1 Tax=Devosia ureilytica TaxID=2952754 RepID=A0A9Q4APB8_9HYPH|nr:helix-turn-helix domain-containing protein [Devosia ureilytica]MCP8884285.1 chromosomal replication initiator DnaA [Devosia ureilytica]MCP8887893.1 chromosomal replication initiator DnaA [Devosia ureilytica]